MTPTAACHYIKIFNSEEVLRRPFQLTTTSRFSTFGKPRDAHRNVPLHQNLQLLESLVTPTAAYHYIKIFKSWGLVTPTAIYHYIRIFNSLEASQSPPQLTATSRFSTPGRFRDAHRSLPLRQDLQLLLGRLRDAHRSLPLHQDPDLLGSLVTPTATYHYIKIVSS